MASPIAPGTGADTSAGGTYSGHRSSSTGPALTLADPLNKTGGAGYGNTMLSAQHEKKTFAM